MIRALALAANLCLIAPVAEAQTWISEFGRDHPLAGRIWQPATGEFVAEADAVAWMARARYVLLGESHDNPDHHVMQARVIRALTGMGRRPAIAFEMLDPGQQAALDRYLASGPADAAGLGRAVNWRGWPDWRYYQPIADAALAAGLPMVPANLQPGLLRSASRGDLGVLDPDMVARAGLATPLPDDVRTSMEADMAAAHCGLPTAAAAELAAAQRIRDASFAYALATAGAGGGAVLIAGSGHVRSDYGVPRALELMAPGEAVAAVAFVKVLAGWTEPEQYAAGYRADVLPFDLVWFTPGSGSGDPCG